MMDNDPAATSWHHWYLADDQQLRQDTHFRYYGLGDVVRYEHLEDT